MDREQRMNEEIDIPEKQPYEGKATQKQKQKVWELGFAEQEVIDDLGKAQASALIDQLIVIQLKRADIAFYKKKALTWLIGVVVFLVMIATGNLMPESIYSPTLITWGYILSFGCFLAVIKNALILLRVKIRRQ